MYLKHFRVIMKHKRYVMSECFKIWLYWQGIIHDISKLSPTEFLISAKYFQWSSSPIDRERAERLYSIARLNHKAKNKHHWHYWIDIDRWEIILIPMPRKYALEMCCDFIWAGKAYNNVTNDKWEPLKYRLENINKTYINKYTIALVTWALTMYRDYWYLPKK
jgi:hypothetical protein